MSELHLLNRVQLANQLPLNRAAIAFLPPSWGTYGEMAVLSLMRWGLDNGLAPTPLDPSHPDQEQLMTQINLMASWQPADAMEFLLDPEQEGDGSTALYPEELADEPTAEDAASLLLQLLYEAMVATAP